MSNDLLIKINADAANAKKEFDDIKSQTEDLDGALQKAAVASGIVFAALTATIYSTDRAFADASRSAVQLSNALQNQGIYTEELTKEYQSYATAVQEATGLDDDAITSAQAVAQSYLGQTKITKELTMAIADLGVSMGGDLNGAAEKIARTIGTSTNAFAKQGLEISATATTAERYQKVVEFVQNKTGGLAAEFNKADGYAKALATSFGNLQEKIGEKFAPALAAGRQSMIKFFDTISLSPALTDLSTSLITAGTVVSGVITFAAAAVPAFNTLRAAVLALGVSMNVAFVGIPLLIAGITTAITYAALNWDKTWAGMRATVSAAMTFFREVFSGLGQLLIGALEFNPKMLQDGLKQISESLTKTKESFVQTYDEVYAVQTEGARKQDEAKKAQAAKEAALARQHQANLVEINKQQIELLNMQNENASQTLIDLKQKEIDTLKALDEQKSAGELQALRDRLVIIRELQDQYEEEELERIAEFEQVKLETRNTLQEQNISIETNIAEARMATIRAQLRTEADTDRAIQEEILQKRIAVRNQDMMDRKKYGAAIAEINKTLNSEEVQGIKSASEELVQLQQSKNAQLKEIGKAAAIASITVSTAESAMNIYKGFSAIPIVGPALGVAGAAAAVAFGAERISTVLGAQEGGLVEGGIPGKDSVPAMLEPGELVVPKKNFNEVVGAVQGQGAGGANPDMLAALDRIEQKLSTPNVYNFNGDVLAEDSFIDRLVSQISDAIQYRNAKIVGVNS